MRSLCTAVFVFYSVRNKSSCVEASSRSVESAYDTNKGVFSPQGRLTQLDYVEGIVKRGNLCIGAECKDGVVLVTNKLMSADMAKLMGEGGGVRRIYRVDSHIAILPAGLPADGRALAHKAMEYCRSHRREYGEPMPGRVLAERLGEFIHAAIVRWGSRAYPNTLFLACWEEDEIVNEEGGADGATFPGAEGSADSQEASTGARSDEGEEAISGSIEIVAGGTDAEMKSAAAEAAAPLESGVGSDGDPPHAGRDESFQLFAVEPSGATRRYKAACTGRGSTNTRTWLHSRSSLLVDEGTVSYANSAGTTGGRGERVGQKGRAGRRLRPGDDEDDGSESQELVGKSATESAAAAKRPARGRRRLLTEMSCAEVSRALVKAAERSRGNGAGGGKGIADAGGDVVGIPEVAWLTLKRSGSRHRAEFVRGSSPDGAESEEKGEGVE